MTANELTRQILEYLNRYGCYVWRQNQIRVPGRRFVGKKGVPDICGVNRSGKFLGIEIKVGDDNPSDHQLLFQSEVRRRGGIYVFARSLSDVEDVL